MLDHRMSLIFDFNNVNEFQSYTNIDSQKLEDNILRINKICDNLKIPHLSIEDGKFQIPKELTKQWDKFYIQESKINISKEERKIYILLLIFSKIDALSLYDFQYSLNVSKNTVVNDLALLRKELALREIYLTFSRERGYNLEGEELEIRALIFEVIQSLGITNQGKVILTRIFYQYDKRYFATLDILLQNILKNYSIKIVTERYQSSIFFIAAVILRAREYTLTTSFKQDEEIVNTDFMKAALELTDNFLELKDRNKESKYIAIILLTLNESNIQIDSFNFLYDYTLEIIDEVERIGVLKVSNHTDFSRSLYNHLVPAYFRIKYSLMIHNLMVDEIKEDYREMYIVVSLALEQFRGLLGKGIPDDEIAYFTILFAGSIESEKVSFSNLKAITVCSSGISSSTIMLSELKKLFPNVKFIKSIGYDDIEKEIEVQDIDLVFSSIPIRTSKRTYIINPIMSDYEKRKLKNKVEDEILETFTEEPSVEDVIDSVLQYVEIKKNVSVTELRNKVRKDLSKKYDRKVDKRPMLLDLLTPKTITFINEVSGWEEAIAASATPLLETNKINQSYIDAMILKVKENGPFINIGKNIALPHARPEDGVNEIGMSLLRLGKPVYLLDDPKHPVSVFICLAAVDNNLHLRALAELTTVLSEEQNLMDLVEANNIDEIIEVLKREEV